MDTLGKLAFCSCEAFCNPFVSLHPFLFKGSSTWSKKKDVSVQSNWQYGHQAGKCTQTTIHKKIPTFFNQTDTLHEVYTMLDGEDTVAILKLKDGLDRLHQSKMRYNDNKGPYFLFILRYGLGILGIICKLCFLTLTLTMLFLGCVDYGMLQKIGGSVVCSPGRTKLDRERTSLCLAEIVKI